MTKRFFRSLLLIGVIATVTGCSERASTVVTDERSEAEQQASYDDYDKQMAEDSKNYK
ncbi:hypothetical protein K227x_40350 [Rubripirellula lacrimiformis]|uniref:Uncharacterized protein n=1 Tax=Rubripirellula lacrimiformis TaxID=1930273 RepID=A0A517NES3_9BACT|nr:hypothetical protein [Rubripirellula lacrimiformis]QDT05634.1 hypothetical protein K227x_40350 [Rubripirellula lacrimiformis]